MNVPPEEQFKDLVRHLTTKLEWRCRQIKMSGLTQAEIDSVNDIGDFYKKLIKLRKKSYGKRNTI